MIKEYFYDFSGYNKQLFLLVNHLALPNWLDNSLLYISQAFEIKLFPIYLLIGVLGYFLSKKSFSLELLYKLAWGYMLLLFFVGGGKILFAMPRPVVVMPHEVKLLLAVPLKYQYFSFPSGHTSLVWLIFFIIKRYSNFWLASLFFMVAATVSFARIYIGHHFPADVFYSSLIGTGLAYLTHLITSKYSLEYCLNFVSKRLAGGLR